MLAGPSCHSRTVLEKSESTYTATACAVGRAASFILTALAALYRQAADCAGHAVPVCRESWLDKSE